MDALNIILLAAGIGSRMKQPIPKVLIPIDHVPMIVRVLIMLSESKIIIGRFILVIRPEEESTFKTEIPRYFHSDIPIHYITQEESDGYGTAAAVQSVLRREDPSLIGEWNMIINGDTPLLEAKSMEKMRDTIKNGVDLILGTIFMKDPSGYGRILHHKPMYIMEQKEIDILPVDHEARIIKEVNTGIYLVRKALLLRVQEIEVCPVTREKKLTDICRLAQNPVCFSGFTIQEIININTPLDRNYAEYILYKKRQEDIHRSLYTLLRKELRS